MELYVGRTWVPTPCGGPMALLLRPLSPHDESYG